MLKDKELVEIGEAKAFIEANWPNDPLLRQIVLNLLKKLPRAKEQTKPATRADQIRAMSDEALADALYELDSSICKRDPRCRDLLDAGEDIPDEWCRGCMLEWLRQPAGDV